MQLTYGGLKPSAAATMSEHAAGSRSEIQLIKGKHICLSMLDLHIKTCSLVSEIVENFGLDFQFESAEPEEEDFVPE